MLKKYFKGCIFFSLLSLSVCAFAQNLGDYNYLARNSDSDDAGKQCVQQIPVCNITPDAGPRVSHGADVFITADFIYWAVREDGLGYATTGNSVSGVNAGKGSVHHVDFDWEPGFKVGLGANLNHDGWDLFAEYTWLRSHPSKSTVSRDPADNANQIQPLWLIGSLDEGGNITFASGDWDFHFNVIDLELGRNFYISKYLTMRPHVGLKGTWQDENLKVRYRGRSEVPSGCSSLSDLDAPCLSNNGVEIPSNPHMCVSGTEECNKLSTTLLIDCDLATAAPYLCSIQPNQQGTPFMNRMKSDIDYWGVGIRFGMDNAWYFMRNFCLFGDWALSALWSRYDVVRKDAVTSDVSDPSTTIVTGNNENDFHSLKGVLELAIGFRFDIWWDDDDYHFGLQAGWEEQIWFNHNQYLNFLQEASQGDLVLHGLTVKARFDF